MSKVDRYPITASDMFLKRVRNPNYLKEAQKKFLEKSLNPVLEEESNLSSSKKPLTDLEMIENVIAVCKTAINNHHLEDLEDLKVLEPMVEEDFKNSLLIEDVDSIGLELLLEDVDPLEYNPQYYVKPKTKPITTNKNWYI